MLSLGDKYLDYTVTAFIGRGGMGTVLLLEKEDGEKAALKILHPHLMDDEELVQRFYLEAEVAGRIKSPLVCKVFDVRRVSLGEKDSHGILMEYVEGESLADMMEQGEVYGEDWALQVADGVLEALVAIHKAGLLHRDIKPENILITPDDTIKLLDLGLAKVMESSIKLSKTGYFIGTYQYASPEQLTGEDLDPSCDIYSLGTVLYELTTGVRPHKSSDLRELIHDKVNVPIRPPGRINPTLTPFFDMLITDMMAIKSSKRFKTAARVRELIREREKSDWYRAQVSLSISRESLSKQSTLRRLVRVPRRTALYGRKKENEKLLGWTNQALGYPLEEGLEPSEDVGAGILIGGEAGIGKTRLIEEIIIRLEAQEKSHLILVGRSQQERQHVPYGSLIDMVRDFFLLDDEPEVDLFELFSDYLPNLRPLIPPFLELVTRRSYLDESQIRGTLNESNLLHLFQTLFSTIAKEIPLVLFFDDLQWADVNSIGVVSYLISGLGDSPLLILGAFREEELESEEDEAHPMVELLAKFARTSTVNRISLERLDREASLDIIEECFPGAAFVKSLAERVYEKSDGNPFFIMEILNLLYDEGRVGFVDGRWEMRGETADIEIPTSLRDIVAFRLDRLSDKEREVLEAASIVGYRFQSSLLGELIEISRIKLLRILQKLEKNRRLIVSYEAGYRFDHHVVYETVYSDILPELRVEYHNLAAELLLATGNIHLVVYKLVYHLRRAGEDERLLENLPIAFGRARSEYSNRLALEHAEWTWQAYKSLGYPEKYRLLVADLMGEWSEVAGILGERDDELTSAEIMLDLARQLDDPSRISLSNRFLGEYYLHISEWDKALEYYQLALESCPYEDGTEVASIHRNMGAVHFLKGKLDFAIENYHKALDYLKKSSSSTELVLTHNNLGICLKRVGKLDEAIVHYETAQFVAEQSGDLHAETFPLGNIALIHYDAGRYEKAHELFVKHLNILEQTGDMTSRARTLLNLGNIFFQIGLYDQAEDYFKNSLKARQRMSHRQGEAIVLHHLAHIDCERGNFSECIDRLSEALVIHAEIGDRRGEANALGVLARVNNLAGRHKVALDCAISALGIAKIGGFENRMIEAKLEALIARIEQKIDTEEIPGEVISVLEQLGAGGLASQGPRALKRLSELLECCELNEKAGECRGIVREIVERNLSQLEDPEWCASYRLMYQGILQ